MGKYYGTHGYEVSPYFDFHGHRFSALRMNIIFLLSFDNPDLFGQKYK